MELRAGAVWLCTCAMCVWCVCVSACPVSIIKGKKDLESGKERVISILIIDQSKRVRGERKLSIRKRAVEASE